MKSQACLRSSGSFLRDANSGGNLVVFIISNFLQIAILAKYFSKLDFPLLQYL